MLTTRPVDPAAGTFRDSYAEALALGQVLFHEDRLRELHVPVECFSSSRARVYRILRRRFEAGEPVDFLAVLPELRASGVSLTAVNAVAEWLEVPTGLAELRQRLLERRVRRTIYAAGEQLIVTATNENLHVLDVITAGCAVASTLERLR